MGPPERPVRVKLSGELDKGDSMVICIVISYVLHIACSMFPAIPPTSTHKRM